MDRQSDDQGLRSHFSPSTKQSMISYKTGAQGLAFSKSQTILGFGSKKDVMAKSVIKKQTHDMDSLLKQIKQKMNSFEKTLSTHDKQLSEIRQRGNNSFFSSSDSFYRNDGYPNVNPQLIHSIRKQLQNDHFNLRNSLFSQIDYLKSQLHQKYIRKNDIEFTFEKFELNMNNLFSAPMRQVNELKNKLKLETENLYSSLNQQINSKIRDIHDSNSKYFKELNACIENIQTSVKNIRQQNKPTFFTSNQKCYSPKLIKYKQVIQKLSSNSYEKQGKQINIGQVTYFVDHDGYLLDASHYYLIDKNNKQIKIDSKQMHIFNQYDLMR